MHIEQDLMMFLIIFELPTSSQHKNLKFIYYTNSHNKKAAKYTKILSFSIIFMGHS